MKFFRNLFSRGETRSKIEEPPRRQFTRLTVSVPNNSGLGSGQRMYAGAQVNRLNADWRISLSSADAEIMVSAIALRNRNRQLERDDDYMRSMLFILENNVVGHQGSKFLLPIKSGEGSYDKELIKKVRTAWRKYFRQQNCCVSRNLTGVEVQRLAVRRLGADGAILFRLHRPFDNPFSFAIEPIEIDRLDHNYNRPNAAPNGNDIQFGIERDRHKAAVAYHILTRHPGEVFAWSSGPKYRERVPAEDIIPIWTIERAGQGIGMPLWPSIGSRLNMVHKYEEAELVAARVAAAKGGWFKKDPNGPQAQQYEGPEDEQGNKLTNTEPGMWEELPVGWDPVQNNPQHPMDAYPYFIKSQLRGASAGANLPYNSVANDLEGVNYSSIRAGLLDARDGFKYFQDFLNEKLMERWFSEWLPFAILSKQLDVGFERMQEILDTMRWYGRRWGWVDPLNDIKAHTMAVSQGFISRRRVIAESLEGGDIESVYEEMEEDAKLAAEHGLNFNAAAKPGEEKPDPKEDK